MEIIKLLLVFLTIIIIMCMKKPLNTAMLAATGVTIFLYGLTPDVTVEALFKGSFSRATIETILVLYAITFLQRMMEKRGDLSNSRVALSGLFNNRRINVSVAPFLLGCLPAASTVLMCGPIVRESIGDELSTPEKAAITTYFRHISESFLPTYTTIFIAVELTNGAVTVNRFVLAMIPMVIALFVSGYLIYLRRIPKDTGMVPDQPKKYYWKLLAKSTWAIGLSILLVLLFNMPVALAVLVCIIINIFVNKFTFKEILPFFGKAFEGKLMVNTVIIMVFKEVLEATGVISSLPEFFSTLPVPSFLIFALIFFFGAVVAGSKGIIVLCMPMAMASLSGAPALSLFTLLMCMCYVAMQVSPVHICLSLCAEDYKVPLSSLVAKTVPMVLVFTVISFAYYFLLSAIGL